MEDRSAPRPAPRIPDGDQRGAWGAVSEVFDADDPLGPLADPEIVARLIGDGVVLFSAIADDGTIAWMGGSADRILGRPAAELIGTNALDLVHPDDQEVVAFTFSEAARESRDRILAVLRLAHADGTWPAFELGGMDLRGTDGSGLFLSWGRPYASTQGLLDLLGSLLTARDPAQVLDQAVRWCDALAPDSASVVVRRDADGRYRAAAWATLPEALGADLAVDEDTPGPWVEALVRGRMGDLPTDRLEDPLAAAAASDGIHQVWAAPVPGDDEGPVEALLVCWRRRPGPILATHRRHLEETARLVQLALRWAESHRDLLTRATTDPLTGVGNRAALAERVTADRPDRAALLFCDLDSFKRVNDDHGHLVGDGILRVVAARLVRAVRRRGQVVRLGGDEFAVWCTELGPDDDAEAVALDVMAALEPPIEVDGTAHRVGCSIGVAVVTADDPRAGDLEALLRAADASLYEAKRAGGSRVGSSGEG